MWIIIDIIYIYVVKSKFWKNHSNNQNFVIKWALEFNKHILFFFFALKEHLKAFFPCFALKEIRTFFISYRTKHSSLNHLFCMILNPERIAVAIEQLISILLFFIVISQIIFSLILYSFYSNIVLYMYFVYCFNWIFFAIWLLRFSLSFSLSFVIFIRSLISKFFRIYLD